MKRWIVILYCLVLGLNVMAAETPREGSGDADNTKSQARSESNKRVVLYKFKNGQVLESGMTIDQVKEVVSAVDRNYSLQDSVFGTEISYVLGNIFRLGNFIKSHQYERRICDEKNNTLCILLFLSPIDETAPLVSGYEEISCSKEKPPVLFAVILEVNASKNRVLSRYMKKYPNAKRGEAAYVYEKGELKIPVGCVVDIIAKGHVMICIEEIETESTKVLISDGFFIFKIKNAVLRELERRERFRRQKADEALEKL